ncbi:MAG: prepilin-type N-terminal cleavage/methylation domain-containing protein [Phycisphaerales bacterium]|nr:prepilin-type N-terminal cleavage/methylation domain-containing protein [Phycisphaerales bacterium]
MNVAHRSNRRGFTLVELLTVIAIISLLISILVPSLQAARNQAKKTATAAQIASLDTGTEMFRNDFNQYPRSGGSNPFEAPAGQDPYNAGSVFLSGAQWLGLSLMGADRQGYVKPTRENDTNDDAFLDSDDWNEWYAVAPNREYSRFGPYADQDPKNAKTPIEFVQELPNGIAGAPSILFGSNPTYGGVAGGTGGAGPWNNGRIPMFVDAFGFPILYYKASLNAKRPASYGSGGGLLVGTYDQSHNAMFTGYDAQNGQYTFTGSDRGWDLTGGGGFASASDPVHPAGVLGYSRAPSATQAPTELPNRPSFLASIYDVEVFDQTYNGSQGKLVTRKNDSFILWSPGKDGLWGTSDDVSNFNQ